MAQPSSAQLARDWFNEVWNRRNGDMVGKLMDPNCVGHMEGAEVRSPADFLKARASLLEAFPDLAVKVEDVIAEGDQAVVRWSCVGTHGGAGLGIPPSSRKASFRGMSWIRFSGGKIVEGWDAWNQGLLLEQLAAPVGAAENSGTA